MGRVNEEIRQAFNPNNGQGARYIDYKITYGATEEKARLTASVKAQSDSSISKDNQIFNNNFESLMFSHFETFGFPLDGSRTLLPKDHSRRDYEMGLILNELSGDNGIYDTPQIITITTPEKYDLLAVGIDFTDAIMADFSISYYSDNNLIATHNKTNNDKRLYYAIQGVENVNKVVLSITRSVLGYRRVRISEFVFGMIIHYDRENSEKLYINSETDILSERAVIGTLKLDTDNIAKEFNIFDPTGIYSFFKERQEIKPKIGAMLESGKYEYIEMGTYYLKKPSLKNNFTTLEIDAVDIRGILSDTIYNKGQYKTSTIADVVEEIANDAGVMCTYPDSFYNIVTTTYIPTVSHLEALRMIAQATCMVIVPNSLGGISFISQGTDIVQEITQDDYDMNNGLSVTDSEIINAVAVDVCSLIVKEEAEELAEISGQGTHIVNYSASVNQTISISGGVVENAVFYADNATVTITGGTAKIFGKVIEQKYTAQRKSLGKAGRQYEYKVSKNHLITNNFADNVLEFTMSQTAIKRKKISVNYRGYPYLQVGDTLGVSIENNSAPSYVITKTDINILGGMTGTLQLKEV